jgi:hypothetical protein
MRQVKGGSIGMLSHFSNDIPSHFTLLEYAGDFSLKPIRR